MGAPSVCIVVVTYNSYSDVRRLLGSLCSLRYPRSKLRVVIVDNGSTDGTWRVVHEFGDKLNLKLVRLSRNLGFAAANNIAFRLLCRRADYILLLNPDVVVTDSDMLAKLLDYMKEAKVPIVGCSLAYEEGVDSAGVVVDPLYTPIDAFIGLRSREAVRILPRLCRLLYVPAACMACLVLDSRVLERVGLLDDSMFMYFEDAEWCLRAWSRGVPVAVFLEFPAVHARGSSLRRAGGGLRRAVSLTAVRNLVSIACRFGGPIPCMLRLLVYVIYGLLARDKGVVRAALSGVCRRRGRVDARLLLKRLSPRSYYLFWYLKGRLGGLGGREARMYAAWMLGLEYLRQAVRRGLCLSKD